MKVITFSIGARWCAMAVDQLVEILPGRELLSLPSNGPNGDAPGGMDTVGMIDYRGKAIPVRRLHLDQSGHAGGDREQSDGPQRRRFLVLGGGPPKALEVNRVGAVVELDDQSIQPSGEVGLADHPVIAGVCRLNDAYAFVINGAALTEDRGVAGGRGGVRGASNG